MSAIEEALRLDQPKADAEGAATPEPKLPATTENDLKLDLPRIEQPAAPPAAAPAAAPPPVSYKNIPPHHKPSIISFSVFFL